MAFTETTHDVVAFEYGCDDGNGGTEMRPYHFVGVETKEKDFLLRAIAALAAVESNVRPPDNVITHSVTHVTEIVKVKR